MRVRRSRSTIELCWRASKESSEVVLQNERQMPATASRYLRFTIVILLACATANDSASAQWMGRQTGCYADPIAANPNRPRVSNPAHVTQYGVLELEYGWDRFWPQQNVTQTSLGGLLKFGMFCDIEFRWNTTSFFSQSDATGTPRCQFGLPCQEYCQATDTF